MKLTRFRGEANTFAAASVVSAVHPVVCAFDGRRAPRSPATVTQHRQLAGMRVDPRPCGANPFARRRKNSPWGRPPSVRGELCQLYDAVCWSMEREILVGSAGAGTDAEYSNDAATVREHERAVSWNRSQRRIS